jgi:mannose-1-phosphate guanylyltransferase
MNVMILAAGEGIRLRPYTLQTPKPAVPFLTVPLACYSLSLLEKIKIDNLVVNTFHLPDQVKELFRRLNIPAKNLCFSDERGQLLGSGGGIHNAESFLEGSGDFLVMNGDEVILPSFPHLLPDMLDFHRWHKGLATLLVMDHPEVGKRFGGAWAKPGQGLRVEKISCFSKTQPAPDFKGYHFLGVMIFSERIFSYFKESVVEENILYETLTKAMEQGEDVYAFKSDPCWFETGNPTDFLAATKFCLEALTSETPADARPYWQEYLTQTIRLWSEGRCLIEKDQPGLEEQVKNLGRFLASQP